MKLRNTLALIAILSITSATSLRAQNAQTYHTGSILLDNGTGNPLLINPPSTGGSQTLTWPTGGYLPLAGGTMTGALKTGTQLLLSTGDSVAKASLTIPDVTAFVIDAGGTLTADFAITLPTASAAVNGKVMFIKNEDIHTAMNAAGSIPPGKSAEYIVVGGAWHQFPGASAATVAN
jgi:hypothetical protein